MPKIQILNETQVDHFMDSLNKEFKAMFLSKEQELLEQAKNEKDNFSTHEEVVKLEKTQKERLEEILMVVDLMKKFDLEKYILKGKNWNENQITDRAREIIEDPTILEKINKDNSTAVEDLKIELSKKNLHVDDSWQRWNQLLYDVKAKLCVTALADAETIKKIALESIDVDSYFTN